jgi:hypothetical protein
MAELPKDKTLVCPAIIIFEGEIRRNTKPSFNYIRTEKYEPAMSKLFYLQYYWRMVSSGRLCRVTINLVLLAIISQFSSLWAHEAHAQELATTDNVAFVLEKRRPMRFTSGKIPIKGELHLNLFILPRDGNTWSETMNFTVAGPDHHERARSNGKVMVAGGLGKSLISVSAELYDSVTHTWLTRGVLNTGRWQHSSVLPLNGRVLVWVGLVAPF